MNLLFLHNISNRKCKIQAQLILRVGSVLIVHKTAKVATVQFFFAKTCVLLTLKEEQSVQLGVTFSVKLKNQEKKFLSLLICKSKLPSISDVRHNFKVLILIKCPRKSLKGKMIPNKDYVSKIANSTYGLVVMDGCNSFLNLDVTSDSFIIIKYIG